MGSTTGRIHHFLSNLEADYFELLDFNDEVIDIQEQYALLPVSSTLLIAEEMGFRPAWIQKPKKLTVMTTDFLVSVSSSGKDYKAARSVKPSQELENGRVLEKLAVEEEWWDRHGVHDYKIVTEREIDPSTVTNIRRVRQCALLSAKEPFNALSKEEQESLAAGFMDKLNARPESSVAYLSCVFEEEHNLPTGAGLTLYQHLVANKRLLVDMSIPSLEVDKPFAEVRF